VFALDNADENGGGLTSSFVSLFCQMPEHKAAGWKTPVWEEYKTILAQAEARDIALEEVERFAFYARSKQAYAVVATG